MDHIFLAVYYVVMAAIGAACGWWLFYQRSKETNKSMRLLQLIFAGAGFIGFAGGTAALLALLLGWLL